MGKDGNQFQDRPASGAPTGAGAGALDPLFQGEERVEGATPRATLLFQFFLFPLLIVLASVGVFLFFGAIGGSDRSPEQYLDSVMHGGTNEQKQAAHQLGVALWKERQRVDAGEIKLTEAFYVKDGGFVAKLAKAFEASFPEQSPERQKFLTLSLGFVGAPAYRPLLEAHAGPSTPPEIRQAVAQSLGRLQTDETVPALTALLKDSDEVVRNLAAQALSQRKTPGSIPRSRARSTTTASSCRWTPPRPSRSSGTPRGRTLLAQLLDPVWVAKTVATPGGAPADPTADKPADRRAQVRAAALTNGIRGAFALKADDLRPKIEALKDDPDETVRRLARDVLDRWPPPR